VLTSPTQTEEPNKCSVVEFTARFLAALSYQLLRPKFALLAKLREISLGFAERLQSGSENQLFFVDVRDKRRALLQFELPSNLGGKPDSPAPSTFTVNRSILLLFHISILQRFGAQSPTAGTSYKDGCAPGRAPSRCPSSCNCVSSIR
jgi:hypothetical protein